MIPRALLACPLALVLGCGVAPPPPAAPPPVEPGAIASIAADAPPAPPTRGVAKDAERSPDPKTPEPPPPGAVARAAVSPTDAPLTGTITQDEVMNQVGRSSDLFNRCYSLGAGASKSWRAKVTVKATVGPTGNVGAVDVVSSNARNAKVDACVVDAFKKLQFPRAKGAGATTFTFPLSFEPMEQVH